MKEPCLRTDGLAQFATWSTVSCVSVRSCRFRSNFVCLLCSDTCVACWMRFALRLTLRKCVNMFCTCLAGSAVIYSCVCITTRMSTQIERLGYRDTYTLHSHTNTISTSRYHLQNLPCSLVCSTQKHLRPCYSVNVCVLFC